MYAKCDSYFHRANLTGAHIPSNQWPEIPHIAHRPFGGDSIARFNTSRDLDEGAGVVLRDGRIYEVSTRLLSLQCAGRLRPNAQKHKVVGAPHILHKANQRNRRGAYMSNLRLRSMGNDITRVRNIGILRL